MFSYAVLQAPFLKTLKRKVKSLFVRYLKDLTLQCRPLQPICVHIFIFFKFSGFGLYSGVINRVEMALI